MSKLFEHKKIVTLREIDHKYFDQYGEEYMSQSKFVSQFKNEFDAEKMSKLSAGKELKTLGIKATTEKIEELAQKKRVSWDEMRDDASSHGNIIHNALEHFGRGQYEKIKKSFVPLCKQVYSRHLNKAKWFPEQILFLDEAKIAGMLDLPIARTNSLSSIIDIDDHKTNVRRGIEFHNKYGQFMKFPLNHLEDCNYNHYALQLSLYGYMMRETYNLKPGTLTINYIKAELDGEELVNYELVHYPVSFMYHEIEAMLDWHMAQSFTKTNEAVEP